MSTAAGMSGQYADCDEFIDYQIQAARNRIKWTELLTALLLAGVLLIGYVLVFTVFDHWIISGGFGPWTRAVMLVAVLVVCSGIVYRYVIRPWTRNISALYAARMLDQEDPRFEGTLLSVVDLNASGVAAPEAIRRAIEKRAAVRLSEVNLDEVIDRRWLMQLGVTLFVLVVTTCLYAVFSPKSINLLRPLTLASSSVSTTTRILKVSPGDTIIDAGQQLEIVADIGGNIPDEVVVTYTTQDKTYVDQKLVMQPTEDEGRFRVLMVGESDRGLRQNLTYMIHAGDAASDEYQVAVTQPPRATVTRLQYAYPEYMDLTSRTIEHGNIDVWEGTEIQLTAESNVPLKSALLKFSDDAAFSTPAEEVPLSISEKKLTGRFQMTLRDDGTAPEFYRIDVTDQNDRRDPSPTVYAVNVRPDKAPVVRLLDPIRDLPMPSNAVVPLLVEAEDPDFLLRSVKLNYEVNGQPRTPELLFDATRSGLRKSWTGTREFSLEPLDLQPGDVVRYFMTARDNRPPLGNQSRTGVLQFMIEAPATAQEVQQRLKQDLEHQQQQLEEAGRTDRTAPEPGEGDPDAEAGEGTATPESDPGSADPSQKPTAAGEKPGARDATDSVSGEQTGEPTDSGSAEGQQTSGESGRSENTDEASRENAGTQPSETAGDSQESARKPATEDEALQRLLEKYTRNSENNDGGSDQPSDTTGAPDESPGVEAPSTGSQDAAADTAESMKDPSRQDDRESGQSLKDDTTPGDKLTDPGASQKGAGENQSGEADGQKPADDQTPADNQKPGAGATDAAESPKPRDEAGGDPKQSGENTKPAEGAGKPDQDSPDQKPENADPTDQKMADDSSKANGQEQTGQDQSGQDQSGQGQSGQGQSGQGQSGQGQSGQGQSGQGQSGQGQSGQGQSGQGQSGQGQSGQGQSGEGQSGQGQSGQGQSGQGQNGQGQSGQGQSGQGQSGQGQSGQGQSGHGQSGHGQSGHGQSGQG
ncbi:MAG: hypothetical protein RIK87_07340, partial [Fuerstiella sp.]